MKATSVKEQWESYAAQVLSPDCGVVQRRETLRAFYAGAFAMLMMSFSSAEKMTDDEIKRYIGDLIQECLRFQRHAAMGGA